MAERIKRSRRPALLVTLSEHDVYHLAIDDGYTPPAQDRERWNGQQVPGRTPEANLASFRRFVDGRDDLEDVLIRVAREIDRQASERRSRRGSLPDLHAQVAARQRESLKMS